MASFSHAAFTFLSCSGVNLVLQMFLQKHLYVPLHGMERCKKKRPQYRRSVRCLEAWKYKRKGVCFIYNYLKKKKKKKKKASKKVGLMRVSSQGFVM